MTAVQREQIRQRATTPFHGIKNINMSRAQGKGVRRRDGGKYDPRLSAIIHKMRRKLEEEYEQKFKDRVEELRRQLEKDHRNQKPKGDSPAKRDDGDDDDDDDDSGNDGKGGKGAIPDSQDLSGSPPAKEPDNSADDDQSRNDGQPVPGKPPSQEAHDSAENDQSRNGNQTTENSRPPADEPVAAGNHSVVEGEQTEGKQETSEEAEQTEAKNDTSEETKKTTSPDPFSPESRHFCTSPQSEASEDLPLESDDSSEGSSGDDANASMLSEILAPLTITEMVPVLGRAASSPPELPAPITSSPTPGNTATIPDAAPSTAEQSSDASFAPIVSSQNPASQSAEGQSADADMGLGNEQTANTNTVISSTGNSQNVASELAEGQSADIDMGLENEQTASSATGISSTASLPNPTSESAEGHSADVDMRLESEQTTTSSSTETKDEDQVEEATGEATEKVDEDMEDATAAAEAVTADAEMVDAPADPPVAVQAPAMVAPPMMPTQPAAAPPPRASPFGTAMQWASGLYTPSTASPSYTKVVNTSQPVHPPPPRPSTAYSPLPRTTPPFPLHGINPKKVTYAASPSSADPWKKAPPSAPASPAAGPSSAPHYDPRRTMNRASPPAPASSTAAAGSAPLYDPLRRMDGGHPPAPWAPPPARPPGASPTNTPYHTSRPVQGIPWLGGASPPPSNWTSSGPSLGGSYEESGSPSGALTMPELSAITPRPTVPPRDPSTADNAGGLGSSNASRTSNAPVAQAGRRAPNSPAAGGHLGQTGVGNTPTRRPPYEVKKPSLTEAEKKQLAKDANLCFGKPKQRKPKPFIPSEPPRNLISTNGDPRFTLAQMYGTPISPSPPKSAPKRGNEETSDESNSKRQRSGVDDSEVNTSTSPNPDTGNPQSSNPGLKRARGDDEEDDAAENTKRRRSASGEAGEAAPTSAPANGASDSTVATPGQSSASTMKEEEEDLYGVSDDEEEGAAS